MHAKIPLQRLLVYLIHVVQKRMRSGHFLVASIAFEVARLMFVFASELHLNAHFAFCSVGDLKCERWLRD